MGDEADAMWDAEMIEQGCDDAEKWDREARDRARERHRRWLADPEVKKALHRRPSRGQSTQVRE